MKIAFFVEGYTEVLLIKELALYYYSENDLSFALFKLRGGSKVPVSISLDERHDATNGTPKFTFHIYDCGGLSSIRSMISHQRNTLYSNNFNKIIGIRDVHPDDRIQIPKLRMELPFRVPQKPIPTKFLLCIMETEAWFLAENQHFLKISDQLTNSFIKTKTGIDLQLIDVESIDNPADKLNEIYSYAGMSYQKTKNSIKRTINSLDLFAFFCILPDRIPSLKALITEFDN
jgi:hypothetical protein